jgi:hypothetical protein
MSKTLYIRLIALLCIGMAMALLWDAWWHVAIGRDQFFIPPHTLLYICIGITIIFSFLEWKKTREKLFRNMFLVSLLFPITGILDQTWHKIFGVENLISPIAIWSPPHILILTSLIALSLFALKIVRLEKDILIREILTCGLYGAVLGFLSIFFMPFFPLGSYKVLGFFGAGATALAWIFSVLYIQKKSKQIGLAALTTLFLGIVSSVGPATLVHAAPQVQIANFYNPPFWLFLFSVLLPALMVEAMRKFHSIAKGIFLGLSSGMLFYIPAQFFIKPDFIFGTHQIIIAIASSAIAGLLAAVVSIMTVRSHR